MIRYNDNGNLNTADNCILSPTVKPSDPLRSLSPILSNIIKPIHAPSDTKHNPTPIHKTVLTPPK